MTEGNSFVSELDALRNYVSSLGWMDEGSPEQARDILTNLTALSSSVFVAAARAYPEIFVETNGVPIEALDNLLEQFGDPRDQRPTN